MERARIRGAQRGSVSDLEALFREHWPRAYRAAYLVVHDAAAAEDIAQEAFLAAVRALDRFDRRRPFGPWLHRITVNRAIDWARASSLRAEAEEQDVAASERPDADDRMLPALASLDPDHRAVSRPRRARPPRPLPARHRAAAAPIPLPAARRFPPLTIRPLQAGNVDRKRRAPYTRPLRSPTER